MSRRFLAVSAACLICASLPARADSIELREIRELRQIVEQQSKQIEALTQKVTKLHEALDHQKGTPATASATLPAASTADHPPANAAPTAPNSAAAAPAPASAPSTADAPRAEAVGKHTVAKGETLTSIAKLYNISVAELQKLNKIENDRKLQIGQTLTIPKPIETTSSEKKENP
jgi:LysM repeat protein